MYKYTQCKVLLPKAILLTNGKIPEENFKKLITNYLKRYPNYKFIRLENNFAVCNREDEIADKKGRKKKGGEGSGK